MHKYQKILKLDDAFLRAWPRKCDFKDGNHHYSKRNAHVNEGVYKFPKSNSQVYNFAYKLDLTILDHRQNFEGSSR